MDRKWKLVAFLLLLITGMGSLLISIYFSRWIIQASKFEEEELRRQQDILIWQTIAEAQDEIRILLPLLTGNQNKEDVKTAFDQWKEQAKFPEVINAIYYIRSLKTMDIIAYFPKRNELVLDNDAIDSLDSLGLVKVFKDKKDNGSDTTFAIFNEIYNSGLILLPVIFSSDAKPDISGDQIVSVSASVTLKKEDSEILIEADKEGLDFKFRNDNFFLISLDQRVLFGDLLKSSIEKNLPNYDYKIYKKNSDFVFAEKNAPVKSVVPARRIALSGNLLQSNSEPELNWEYRLNPSANSFIAFSPQQHFGEQAPQEKPIIIDLYSQKDSICATIRTRKTINLIAGNGAILLIWGSILLLTFLYGRSRLLRLREQEFVGTVSHELRTPLAVIMAASDNLTAGVVSDKNKINTYGREIGSQAQRLNRMIEGILNYARLGKKTIFQPKYEICEPKSEVLSIVKPLAEIIKSNGGEIDLQISDIPDKASTDVSSLALALENLIMNAFYHGKPGDGSIQKITISLCPHNNDFIRIVVSDNGPGIRQKEAKQLFKPFYRGERSVKEQHPGSGIGLYVLRKVCRSLGGDAGIYNKKNGESGAGAFAVLPFKIIE